MNDMTCREPYVEFWGRGLVERHRNVTAIADELLISSNGMAHFPGRSHKGGDPDHSRWASLTHATPAKR